VLIDIPTVTHKKKKTWKRVSLPGSLLLSQNAPLPLPFITSLFRPSSQSARTKGKEGKWIEEERID